MRTRPATTVCPTCGSSTAAGQRHCRRCGADLTSPDIWADSTGDVTLPPTPVPPRPPARPRDVRRWRGIALIVLGLVLLGVGIGVGYRAVVAARDEPAAARPPAGGTAVPTVGPTTPGPPAGSPRSGLVEVAPALQGRPETAPVVSVLTAYFTAINARDYRAYRATLVPRPTLPQDETQFRERYRSTVDSDVRLLGLRAGDDGSWVASIGFVSRQDAADAPGGTATCLRWSIAFPLVPAGDGFLIDAAGQSTTVRRPC